VKPCGIKEVKNAFIVYLAGIHSQTNTLIIDKIHLSVLSLTILFHNNRRSPEKKPSVDVLFIVPSSVFNHKYNFKL
jgi:hypothetical protein